MRRTTLALAVTGAACAAGLAAASAQTLPTEVYPFKSGPVTISSCSLGQSGNVVSGNSLEIKYFQNVPRRHLASVTFRVRYAGKVANVTDTGTFSYDAPIDHKFDAFGGTPWAGPNPQVCRVLSATFGDGETVRPPYLGRNGERLDSENETGSPDSNAMAPASGNPPAPGNPVSPAPSAT